MSGAPAAIEEHAGVRPPVLAELVERARPLVIRGLCRDWPMVGWARQSDDAFARGLAALDNGSEVDALLMSPEQQGVIGYNAAFDGFNYTHHRISIGQGLQRLAQYSRRGDAPGLAIQSAPVAGCLPGLLENHALPFLDRAIQPRIWIGNRVTTPAHFDEYHNIACVVCGVRRFTLFAPEQVRNLYVGPLDFAPTGAAISIARLDRPDDPRFPRLKLALAEAQVAELHPGDAIYIPPLWWHHVESLQRINALVNYWWQPVRPAGYAADTVLGCLMHCVLAFRTLPPAQRGAWRTLLDHYVFGDGDPVAHIPAGRRGILGPLTPEQLAEARASIRRYL
ncbi:cupin-like domain-containing protein [Rhodanobacter sp. KK11]|uniref:cupin-like domain-containing protein n=1 Tax=Rhodanobacter sp. KK11 TaxID=3083255 RepID=UPI00296696D5|nr:cupin-like domain-containing protein [Rhodanobacter sp. KK11]MDW2981023.1 cupin-like domain-containing protein [Rhodanobacter sp. KK11]